MPTTSLLVATFSHLLHVVLDQEQNLLSVKSVHTGQGIYHGLTRGPDNQIFVVAKNIGFDKRTPLNPNFGVNKINRVLIGETSGQPVWTEWGLTLGPRLDLLS